MWEQPGKSKNSSQVFGACQQAEGQEVLENLTIYGRIPARPGSKINKIYFTNKRDMVLFVYVCKCVSV